MEATAARLIVDGRTNSSWSSSPFLSQILLAMQKLHQTLQLLSFFSKRGKKSLRRCLRITASYWAAFCWLRKFKNTYGMKFA